MGAPLSSEEDVMGLRSRWVLVCALGLAACAHESGDNRVKEPVASTPAQPAQTATSGPEAMPEAAEVSARTSLPSPVAAPPPMAPVEARPEVEAQKADRPAASGDKSIDDLLNSALGSASSASPAKRTVSGEAKMRGRSVSVRGMSGVGHAYGAGVGALGGAVAQPMAVAPAAHIAKEEEFNREGYAHIAEAEFLNVHDQALSTFSVDVDTASYSNVRRFIRDGQLPPADAVRIEELVNYFDYDYPAPRGDAPFSIYTEVSDCPWNAEHRLVHIGIQGKRIEDRDVPARNLVFLIDVSGSMQDPNKLPLLKSGLSMLARNLRPQDRVSMVVYAGASGLVLPATSGARQNEVLAALDRLEAGGSTNGAAGIELAYQEAQKNFIKGGINRVILATDGDFNVGPSSEGELVRIIEKKRESGVFLTVLGFGTGNVQDSHMEALADKGNGNYAYIDSQDEADKVLVREAGATLVTIAKDVKLQVEFNPAHVASYRLVGYENRTLAARDFNDDKKDAGEIGAGHTVTALYEIVPVGAEEHAAQPMVDALKYQQTTGTAAQNSGELLAVKVRYKAPSASTSQLITMAVQDQHRALRDTSETFRFSAAVAGFGMLLRDSKHKSQLTLPQVRALAESALGGDPHGDKNELLGIIQAAQRLGLGS
jgi:Ca-activated chloride channel family protein